LTLEILVEVFAANVMDQSEFIELGDSVKGNKAAKKYIKAFKEIVDEFSDSGRDALSVNLHHENANVRVMTAAFLLRFKHVESIDVLINESKKDDLVGFSARQTLKRWKDGTWGLDVWDAGS
jgi:hypothetical protein